MNTTDQMSALMAPSRAWVAHTYISFAISLLAVLGGIMSLDMEFWTRGFLLMGVLFLAGNCFSLSKVLRDQHEASTLHHRIDAARTRELLDKYDEPA